MKLLDDDVAVVQWVQEEVQEVEVTRNFSFYHSALPQAYLEASLYQPHEMLSYQNSWVSNPTQT